MLDLELAWKRIKKASFDAGFVENPFLHRLIDIDTTGWLDRLSTAIKDGSYNPVSMMVCDVPKPRYAIRPGSILSIDDQIVYTGIIGAMLNSINQTISWSQGTCDFGHMLKSKIDGLELTHSPFDCWERFRLKSIELIDSGASYVVVSDVVGFYENIDIASLISMVKEIGCEPQHSDLLSKCLNRWAHITGRGIPQGVTASHILAKLYLNSMDEALKGYSISHLRFSDDIRVFCNSMSEAKLAVVKLCELLRLKGLNLNSAKSTILRADEARRDINKIEEIIGPLKKSFTDAAEAHVVADGSFPAINLRAAEEILKKERVRKKSSDSELLPRVKQLFQSHFLDTTENFDKTLFNFCLARLRNFKDSFAVPHCVRFLSTNPEVTGEVLLYLDGVKAWSSISNDLSQFVFSDSAVYPYQLYQIVSQIARCEDDPGLTTTQMVRTLCFSSNVPGYVRIACFAYLKRFGTFTDLGQIKSKYDQSTDELEKASILCSLERLESSARNSFFARAQGDGELQRRAVQLVKRSSPQ